MTTTDGRVESQFTVPAGQTWTATNSGGGPTSIPLTAGAYFPSTFVTMLQAQLNALRTPANWTVTLSTGANGTGQVTINFTGGAGTYSIDFSGSTTARDLIGFTANITGVTHGVATVGTKQARGLWIPDHPLRMDGDRKRAPIVTDLRTTTSPRGAVYGIVGSGNVFYRHTNLQWSNVDYRRIWEAEALTAGGPALANASLEFWFKDTQIGQGSSWFSVASLTQIYDHSAAQVGIDANAGAGVAGWQLTGVTAVDQMVKQAIKNWVGQWAVSWPAIVSSG